MAREIRKGGVVGFQCFGGVDSRMRGREGGQLSAAAAV